MTKPFDLITVLGPTASGKTALAVQMAMSLDAEILSADSRQVYRSMDLGTGKDLSEYEVGGRRIPYHLIDIAEPGEAFDLYRFMKNFKQAYQSVLNRNHQPLMCGGSGLYLEAVLKGYNLVPVQEDLAMREKLELCTDDQLIRKLKSLKSLHNTTDTRDRSRLLRAVEIAMVTHGDKLSPLEKILPDTARHFIVGIQIPRELIRQRITTRLYQRLDDGMVDEVENLLANGVEADRLRYYGLEYKFITNYLNGMISYDEMTGSLNTAIHQFAKRQMTWFRRMEKNGVMIHWVDGTKKPQVLSEEILQML